MAARLTPTPPLVIVGIGVHRVLIPCLKGSFEGVGCWEAFSAYDRVVRRMSLPNSLTLLRIFFVPLLVVLLLTKEPNMDLWAVGVFLLAAITDLLDGYLARRRAQVSRVGILLDPIADKLLT